MKLRITTLSENTAGLGNFLGEWGLSMLVETDEATIMLDTGQGISASYNADILGIDLGKVDKLVLSHGHYDHTGGLRQVLRRMRKKIEVIAHPDIWAAKYATRDKKERFIGIPFQRQELESIGANFNLTRESVKISDNITTTGEIPMITNYEQIETYLVVKGGSGLQPDPLLDDRALVINTEKGLVVLLGCAHHGVINTLYHAQQITGVKPIYMILGGAHLIDASQERIWMTIAALKELGVQRLGLSHCTGMSAAMLIAQEFGDGFFFNNAGTIVNFE